jgi:hypothetical protein
VAHENEDGLSRDRTEAQPDDRRLYPRVALVGFLIGMCILAPLLIGLGRLGVSPALVVVAEVLLCCLGGVVVARWARRS